MSRASGKHGPRAPEAEFGRGDDTGITSTTGNIVNEPVERQEVPVAGPLEEFRGMMAHGVPPADVGHYNREMAAHARHPYQPETERQAPEITPVPVYVVEEGSGPRPLAHAAYHHIAAPAAGSEPVPVCGQDVNRFLVQLLNEDPTHDCRFGQLSDLLYDAQNSKVIGGARLPAGATGYTVIRTQGPIYVVSEDSSAPELSIILEYEIAGAL